MCEITEYKGFQIEDGKVNAEGECVIEKDTLAEAKEWVDAALTEGTSEHCKLLRFTLRKIL